ncbi:MAG: glycosyltransferase [Pirellulaceae bacterium]|nr:glycosyltransferase [Pirellulaceae bacterium]
MTSERLKLLSVSALLPTENRPEVGVFVQRRLEALAELSELDVLRPVPYFPLLRPYRPARLPRQASGSTLAVRDRAMFYLPGVLKQWDGGWMEACVAPALRRRLDEGGLDAIDAHFGYPTGVGCLRAARRLRLPVFITVRGVESVQFGQPRVGPQLVQALRECTGVIAVSEGLKAAAVAAGVGDSQIQVIPNAVDTQRFHPADRDEARRRLGLPLDRPLIVSVGNLVSLKRHHLLMEAFARLRQASPDAQLLIVGGPQYEPTYPHRLRQLASRLGLRNAVRLTGAVPPADVPSYLQAADLFTLASCREGSCNAVLEALACGLPVVVTRVGENERHVQEGVNGFLVPVDDAEALYRALHNALAHRWDPPAIASLLPRGGWSEVARRTVEFMAGRLVRRPATPSAVPCQMTGSRASIPTPSAD